MKRLIASFLAVAAMTLAPMAPAFAAPIAAPYTTTPYDTIQNALAAVVSNVNSAPAMPSAQYNSTCTGTTTATCTGANFTVSITGLTTAAGVTSASMAVTDTSVTAASIPVCVVNGYGGTGNANVVHVVATASTLTFAIQNSHASAALNATVPVSCLIYN